jgi:acylphosphatase
MRPFGPVAECGRGRGEGNEKSRPEPADFAGGKLRIAEKPGIGETATMPAANDVHHETVHFSGRVQGVGFRYTALWLAKEFAVAGYVQNLPDGRVRLEVEGTAEEVARYVAAVEERMQGYVREVERVAGRRPRQYVDFAIR